MKLGFNVYLVHIILLVEGLILFKFRGGRENMRFLLPSPNLNQFNNKDYFSAPFPEYVKAMWLHVAVILFLAFFYISSSKKKKSKSNKVKN